MSIRSTGVGDPARTLSLLWRHKGMATTQRGPKQTLSVDEIVDAAVAIADAEGLDAVSMRRLAQTFDVAPMALYTYVPGKAELLDLMLDRVYAQMTRRRPREHTFRARIKAIADDNRALYVRHPWLSALSTHRPPLGPGVMAKYEHELCAFDGTGLGDVERDAALTFVLGFVAACARSASDARAAQRDSRMGDEAWWNENAPLLANISDAQAFPTAARVGRAAGEHHGAAYDADHAYTFGLARVLDGLDALIDRKATKAPVRARKGKGRSAR